MVYPPYRVQLRICLFLGAIFPYIAFRYTQETSNGISSLLRILFQTLRDLAKLVLTTAIKEANKHIEDVMSRGK